jgi:hypothetical protein
LPQRNLEHAPDILRAYQARQTNDHSRPARPQAAQRAPRALRRIGHVFYKASRGVRFDTETAPARRATRSADTEDGV